jgi:hypothetical protein
MTAPQPPHRAAHNADTTRVELVSQSADKRSEKLTLIERAIEHTTFNVDVAKVLAAIALIVLAWRAPDLMAPLLRFLNG